MQANRRLFEISEKLKCIKSRLFGCHENWPINMCFFSFWSTNNQLLNTYYNYRCNVSKLKLCGMIALSIDESGKVIFIEVGGPSF